MARVIIATRICNPDKGGCGRTFPGGPRAWFCPTCRKERQRTASREYKRRDRRGETRKLGSEDICVICSQPYTVTGSQQRYCPGCSNAAVMAKDAEQGLEYYREHAEIINPKRKISRRRGPRPCIICKTMFDAPTRQNTCGSDTCLKKRDQDWQRRADAKRLDAKKTKSRQE